MRPQCPFEVCNPNRNVTVAVIVTVTLTLTLTLTVAVTVTVTLIVTVDDGLPIRVLYEHKSASQAPDIPDLPLCHMPS